MSFNKEFSSLANPSRRDMLKTLGTMAVIAPGIFTLGGCETLFERIRTRPTRRDLATLAPNDPILEAYRAAVIAMKELHPSDPRNWNRQAEIHSNFCPHENWFFLPWHRAYLLYFEEICRVFSAESSFALPYWNWTCNRTLPDAFLSSVGNPLFHPGRTGNPPAALPDSAVGPSVMNAILDEPNFLIFGSSPSTTQRGRARFGPLEGTPHNFVHGFVGGDMSLVSPAARDPIFWVHHSMVERVWWEWNVVRGFANTNDLDWVDFEFNENFVDGRGNLVSTTPRLLSLAPLLSYRYDDSPITSCGVIELTRDQIDRNALRKLLEEGGATSLRPLRTFLTEEAVDVPVGTTASIVLRVRDPVVSADVPLGPDTRVLLSVVDVTQPPNGDFFVRVFINFPSATADTPTSDPHYAGSFAFFTDAQQDSDQEHAKGTFLVDATATLQRLRGLDQIRSGAEVSVQLVAVPMPGQRQLRQNRLSLRKVELQLVQSVAAEPRPFGATPRKR